MRRGLLGALVCLLLATTASAQTESGQVAISLLGGLDVPTGDAQDLMGNGYAFGGGLAYGVVQRLAFEGEVVFHGDSVSETGDVGGTPVTATLKSQALQMTAGLRYVLSRSRNSFYIKGAAGAYRLTGKIEVGDESLSETETKAGATGGIGFQLVGKERTSTFLEAGYHHIFEAESDGVFSFVIGVRFSVN